MQQDVERFLNLKHPPGRLTKEQAAWFLGFSPDEITTLVTSGLLRPLGHPASNGQKFFLTSTLEDLKRDEKWFSKATDAIVEYWRSKNSRKSQNPAHNQRRLPTRADSSDQQGVKSEPASGIG